MTDTCRFLRCAAGCWPAAVAAVLFACPEPVFSEEGEVPAPAPPMESAQPSQSDHDAGKAHQGLFFGYVLLEDHQGRFLFLKPVVSERPRKTVYLDSHSLYSIDGKPGELKDIRPGDKVAVRYFSEQGCTVAEEVYVVNGPFQPEDYSGKRAKKPDKKSDKSKKSEGAH